MSLKSNLGYKIIFIFVSANHYENCTKKNKIVCYCLHSPLLSPKEIVKM